MAAEFPRREPLAWRRLGTPLALTVAVVCVVEFLILMATYHRGDTVRTQLRAASAFIAVTDMLGQPAGRTPRPEARSVVAATGARLQDLAAAGVPEGDLAAASAALARLSDDPGDAEAAADLRGVAVELTGTLEERASGIDDHAAVAFVAMLAVTSIGWYVYFGRLLRRHRDAQRRASSAHAERVNEKRLHALVQHSADVVIVMDDRARATYVSPSCRRMLGHEPPALAGSSVLDLLDPGDATVLVALLESQRPGDTDSVELAMRHADGRDVVTEGMLTNLTSEDAVRGHVLTVRDVTERHALADRLTLKAFWDDLTGLANRQLIHDRLGSALQARPGADHGHMLLFCDLDDFKNINDSQGHGTGDRLLAEVGARIATLVRPGDTAARLGGDEFAVLMEHADADDARLLGEELLRVLAEPVMIDGVAWTVQASIGIAAAVSGEITPEEAMRNADVAMYWAKDRGKSTIAAYDAALHAEALDRLSLRTEFMRALDECQLVLRYQPTVDLETGRLTGFEALVRWQHPHRGLLAPNRFVPLAEQTGLVVPMGRWVLAEACRAAARMPTWPTAPGMAVNIAAQQLADPDFVNEVLDTLEATGLDPSRLTLEITESVVLQEMAAVTERLAALRERGVRIAIDDFGTGYSSLAYLADLPVDVVKIDKSFIDRVIDDGHAASVTEAVIQMSRKLGMTTVAEGVEQPAQVAWLRRMHCATGQGYLWARPLTYAGALAFLSERATTKAPLAAS